MMRWCILALTLALASASDQCAWGESYWCVSLENAKQCGAFQHCLTTVWKNQKLEQDNADVCAYCENIITDVKGFLTNQKTWAEIQKYLDAACAIIPEEDVSTKCKNMVDNYLTEIVQMMEKEIDPQMICSLLGLCKGLKDTVQHHQVNSLHRVPLIKLPSSQVDPICPDCKKLMQDIKNDFMKSEKQIEQLIKENLCKKLEVLADECNKMVDDYIPQIMDMIASQFDPGMICQVLGFCNQTSRTPKALLAKLKLSKSPLFEAGQVVGNTAGCEICKSVIGELQHMEKEKMTQEEVEEYIKKELCSKLGVLKDACDMSVDKYGPELFQLIYEELDPSVVCQSIGLCSSGRLFNGILPVGILEKQTQTPVIKPKQPIHNSMECTICEMVVKQVDQMLSDNATEAEIQAALDKVCSFLPSHISKQCLDFVDTYGPAIITLLAQELDPHMVCISLGLCDGNQMVKGKVQAGSPGSCEVCKLMMKYLDSVLTQNSTVEEIVRLVEQLCKYLPKKYAAECDTVVEQYGKMIIQLLSQFADPSEICEEIGLCDKPTVNKLPLENMIVEQKVPLLGVNECTYGPAYWCASRENAKKCKAVAHCEKHVWKN